YRRTLGIEPLRFTTNAIPNSTDYNSGAFAIWTEVFLHFASIPALFPTFAKPLYFTISLSLYSFWAISLSSDHGCLGIGSKDRVFLSFLTMVTLPVPLHLKHNPPTIIEL